MSTSFHGLPCNTKNVYSWLWAILPCFLGCALITSSNNLRTRLSSTSVASAASVYISSPSTRLPSVRSLVIPSLSPSHPKRLSLSARATSDLSVTKQSRYFWTDIAKAGMALCGIGLACKCMRKKQTLLATRLFEPDPPPTTASIDCPGVLDSTTSSTFSEQSTMDVTKHNFSTIAPELERLIQECEFVAIDEEMTGISMPGERLTPAHSPAEQYLQRKPVAELYSIIQIGICPFLKDPVDPDRYVAYPFNFFVFPESGGNVVLSPPAIAFNRKHGMDFQKWICEGVPYLNAQTEQKLREKLWPPPQPAEDAKEEPPAKRPRLQKKEDEEWFNEEWKRFQDWLAVPFVKDREFLVSDVNAAQRRYFETEIREHHPDLQLESRLKNPGSGSWAKISVVAQRTEQSKAERAEREAARKAEEFTRKLGFRRIFTALQSSGKPLVGHNHLYDLLFMMAAFDGDLPATWEEWKEKTHQLFPIIYDTKYMAQSRFIAAGRFPNTSLEVLYKALQAEGDGPRVRLPLGFQGYAPEVLEATKQQTNASRAHEAAYDALMTGTVFLRLMGDLRANAAELVNRGNVMFSVFEMNLCGPDPLLSLGPIVHVTFSSTCTTGDLTNAFGDLPGTVSWINDNSAFACMGVDVDMETALRQMKSQDIFTQVQTFEEFQASSRPP